MTFSPLPCNSSLLGPNISPDQIRVLILLLCQKVSTYIVSNTDFRSTKNSAEGDCAMQDEGKFLATSAIITFTRRAVLGSKGNHSKNLSVRGRIL
jgi:hypothetical protein